MPSDRRFPAWRQRKRTADANNRNELLELLRGVVAIARFLFVLSIAAYQLIQHNLPMKKADVRVGFDRLGTVTQTLDRSDVLGSRPLGAASFGVRHLLPFPKRFVPRALDIRGVEEQIRAPTRS